jgi:hypothetical protein
VGALNGDKVVALLGVAMWMMLISRSGAISRLHLSAKLKMALIWAAIFVGVAVAAAALAPYMPR